MALCDDCFEDFVHPLFHELMDKNRRFREKYGGHARWDWDPDSATLTFTDPEKRCQFTDARDWNLNITKGSLDISAALCR